MVASSSGSVVDRGRIAETLETPSLQEGQGEEDKRSGANLFFFPQASGHSEIRLPVRFRYPEGGLEPLATPSSDTSEALIGLEPINTIFSGEVRNDTGVRRINSPNAAIGQDTMLKAFRTSDSFQVYPAPDSSEYAEGQAETVLPEASAGGCDRTDNSQGSVEGGFSSLKVSRSHAPKNPMEKDDCLQASSASFPFTEKSLSHGNCAVPRRQAPGNVVPPAQNEGSGFGFSQSSIPSPPSPEPFRPGSPLKWRSKSSTSLPGITQVPETPAHGLFTRDPSFSEHTHGTFRLFSEAHMSDEPEPSTVAAKLKEAALAMDSVDEPSIEELLTSMGVSLPHDRGSLDYSLALEYHGPPIGQDVPEVAPLVHSVIRHEEMEGPIAPTSLPVASSMEKVSKFSKVFRLRPKGLEVEIRRVLGPASASRVTRLVQPEPAHSSSGTGAVVVPEPASILTAHAGGSEEVTSSSVAQISPDTARLQILPKLEKKVDRSYLVPEVVILSKAQEKYRVATQSEPPDNSNRLQGRGRLPPEMPDSPASTSSATSLAPADVSAHSLSRKSSTSEIEEVVASPSLSASPSIASSLSGPLAGYYNEDKVEVAPSENRDGSAIVPPETLASVAWVSKPRSISLPLEQSVCHGPPNSLVSNSGPAKLLENVGEDTLSSQTQNRRRGGCYHCRKGHRLQDKEVCMVCSSKYCSNCVVVAMGSMPEGRKCVGCIGRPIHESRRPYIGKPSRLLKNILRPLEVQQILKAERECLANQLRPDQLWVNGSKLSLEEMGILLGCGKPPLKLKPGRYWYDSQTGLWGNEGQRPDKIISPSLKVGGHLLADASNGATQVFMNGRELGKLELKMLKLAGVHCPPRTRLWVEKDGSYSEEGQNNKKGNIWGKASIRLLYPFFSLPTPGSSSRGNENSNGFSNRYHDYLEQNNVQKLLLLGHEGSGRSTIFKQAKFLYKDGFTHEEKANFKLLIQANIFKYISILLEGRERFEEEDDDLAETRAQSQQSASVASTTVDSIDLPTLPEGVFTWNEDKKHKIISSGGKSVYAMEARLKQVGDWFLDRMANGNLEAFFPAGIRTQDYVPHVQELWKDEAIKATYKRKAELHSLSDVAGYFLERVLEVSGKEYEPTEDDILRAEGLTQGSGLVQIEFFLEDKVPFSGSWQDGDAPSATGRYQLIRVGGKGMTDRQKWLGMFEDVRAVVFCVALSEYDLMWADNSGALRNKMIQARELFESILKHPCFQDTPFVLLLNKYDVFEEKIYKGIPLTACEWFSDFRPVGASHYTAQNQAQQAYQYIAHKYKEVFNSVNSTVTRKLFTFQLNALDKNTVSGAFQYVREILKWDENRTGWDILPEESSYSTDTSSFLQHSSTS